VAAKNRRLQAELVGLCSRWESWRVSVVRDAAERGRVAVAGALLCMASLLLARAVFRSRGLPATPEIPRASVQRVEAIRLRPPVTRGYFVVHFTEGGQPRKRLVILPGSMSRGTAEFNHACGVLGTCGLPHEGVLSSARSPPQVESFQEGGVAEPGCLNGRPATFLIPSLSKRITDAPCVAFGLRRGGLQPNARSRRPGRFCAPTRAAVRTTASNCHGRL